MAIQALPQTTVRALGASQVLTDSASLVKELIDNAIDAAATSVSIEIHNNTLDIIQVRDNGRGIPPEDRPLVARRYCTSKISHDDELKDIGGSSLGFRGEALASATELSGSLTISTRIEGEQVAAALKISQKGEVAGQDRASLPVGTTVRITDFIKTNPVRRQVALKNTEACLKKIKRLLQSYALARPHIRFSLRVLKAKNTKGDWVYAPKANCSAEDAALKVVGSACASQCTWSVIEEGDFTFQAFLPRPDADASKISNLGSFLSIDRRPVSSARGTPKQIAKAFREALKKASSTLEDIKDPFLFLEITCPKGSYDANLEPAKDDVLFEDPSVVVDGARKLFGAVYSPAPAVPRQDESSAVQASADELQHEGTHDSALVIEQPRQSEVVDLQLDTIDHERSPVTPAPLISEVNKRPVLDDDDETGLPQTFHSNMYDFDEEDLDLVDSRPATSQTNDHFRELQQARKDVDLSNPFMLAKLHSAVRRRPLDQSNNDQPTLTPYPLSSPLRPVDKQIESHMPALPTPRPSSPSPPADEYQCVHPDRVVYARPADNGESMPPRMLQPHTPQHSDFEPVSHDTFGPPARHNAPPTYNYTLDAQSSEPPTGTPINAIPDASSRPRQKRHPRQGNVNKPFVPPFKDQAPREQVWFDFDNVERRQHRPRQNQRGNGLVTQGELGDLEHDPRPITPPRRNRDIRDFVARDNSESAASMIERRNYNRPPPAIDLEAQENQLTADADAPLPAAQGRGFVSAAEVAAMQAYCDSPEKNARRPTKRRKTSERRALQELSTNAPIQVDDEPEPSRPRTSSRALSRRRSSAKLGRTKSSKLPLERIPDGKSIANVILHHATTMHKIGPLAGKIDDDASLLQYNQPAVGPYSSLSSSSLDLHELTIDLHDLLISSGGDDARNPAPRELLEEVRSAFAKLAQNEDEEEDELMSF